MKSIRMSALLFVAALFAVGCGKGSATPSASDTDASVQVAAVKTVLEDAGAAAQRFGQAHLGHFLKMTPRDLRREGLEMPSSVSIAVRTEHTSYCIKAENSELPSIHPWATATLGSKNRTPSTTDRCSL